MHMQVHDHLKHCFYQPSFQKRILHLDQQEQDRRTHADESTCSRSNVLLADAQRGGMKNLHEINSLIGSSLVSPFLNRKKDYKIC